VVNKRTSACVFLRERVGLEPHRFEALVLKLGGPEAIWKATPMALLKSEVFTDEQIGKLVRGRDGRKEFEKDLETLARDGLAAVSCFDEDFPARILAMSHPPSFLYRSGSDPQLEPNLLVAGAMEADATEIAVAVAIGKKLASLNVVLVSNLTEGLETAAHVGALSGEGKHRVFLPCGHRAATAWDSASVLARVIEAGAVYSEFAPDAKPNASRRTEACRLALGTAQGILVLGNLDERISAAVTAAATGGKPVFYVSGGDPDDSEVLRREGGYPLAGPESLERILPLL